MSLYCGPPKFFKVIQNHELQNGELKVPKKFVEKYWKGVPNPAVITLPNGVQQQLFWVKRGGDVLFKKNWEKIAKYLKFGFIVVFKYVGGSCLQLEIFGLNCLEIDYSKMINQVKQEPEFVEINDDEIHIASTSQRRKTGIKRGVTVTDRSFKIKLTPTYTGYIFRIPSEFSRRYLKDFEGTARVRKIGDEDKTWEMEVKNDIQCGSVYTDFW
ncbi:B3 domain-containing transcription factor VRN1 [Trifolium repens]|nr:B3 domain-containing transcription factor VRN1 [Trifolium repens]